MVFASEQIEEQFWYTPSGCHQVSGLSRPGSFRVVGAALPAPPSITLFSFERPAPAPPSSRHSDLLIDSNLTWQFPDIVWLLPTLLWKISQFLSSLIRGPPVFPFTLLWAFSNYSLLGVIFFHPLLTCCFWDFFFFFLVCSLLMPQTCRDYSCPEVSLPTYNIADTTLYPGSIPFLRIWPFDSLICVPHRHFDLIVSKANYLFPQTNSFSYFS